MPAEAKAVAQLQEHSKSELNASAGFLGPAWGGF